ncbi:MAG: ATP-binding cassette domain-containing protein [Corticimicrobacter sp.]|uniref:ABC transporter ATP-binding protein n=1 Tax=Corticimicrobacter sp. TaxID=2678536 RepID=UPI0032DA3C46
MNTPKDNSWGETQRTAGQPVLQVSALRRTIQEAGQPPLDILADISFSVNAGESLAVTGCSGSGKSTLLGLMAGLDVATAGRITLAGHDLTGMDEEARARLRARHVGFVFQSFQLLPNLTALENVMLPLELLGRSARGEAEAMLERVGLEHRLGHYPSTLSGGEQQRVSLARAFVVQPDILFADEPTGSLDSETGSRVIDMLFALQAERHTTLVLVTHDLGLARRCDRQLVLEAGRQVQG